MESPYISTAYLIRDVVWGQFVLHVISESIDDGFSGLTTAAARILGLNVYNCLQHLIGSVSRISKEDILQLLKILF